MWLSFDPLCSLLHDRYNFPLKTTRNHRRCLPGSPQSRFRFEIFCTRLRHFFASSWFLRSSLRFRRLTWMGWQWRPMYWWQNLPRLFYWRLPHCKQWRWLLSFCRSWTEQYIYGCFCPVGCHRAYSKFRQKGPCVLILRFGYPTNRRPRKWWVFLSWHWFALRKSGWYCRFPILFRLSCCFRRWKLWGASISDRELPIRQGVSCLRIRW